MQKDEMDLRLREARQKGEMVQSLRAATWDLVTLDLGLCWSDLGDWEVEWDPLGELGESLPVDESMQGQQYWDRHPARPLKRSVNLLWEPPLRVGPRVQKELPPRFWWHEASVAEKAEEVEGWAREQ